MLDHLIARNERILSWYKRNGCSLRATAEVFGLNHERVRQIIRELEPDMIRPRGPVPKPKPKPATLSPRQQRRSVGQSLRKGRDLACTTPTT